jgi:hypothetical protein
VGQWWASRGMSAGGVSPPQGAPAGRVSGRGPNKSTVADLMRVSVARPPAHFLAEVAVAGL